MKFLVAAFLLALSLAQADTCVVWVRDGPDDLECRYTASSDEPICWWVPVGHYEEYECEATTAKVTAPIRTSTSLASFQKTSPTKPFAFPTTKLTGVKPTVLTATSGTCSEYLCTGIRTVCVEGGCYEEEICGWYESDCSSSSSSASSFSTSLLSKPDSGTVTFQRPSAPAKTKPFTIKLG